VKRRAFKRSTPGARGWTWALHLRVEVIGMRTFELPSRLDVVSTEGIGDPALIVDTFGIVVSCNKEVARLLGLWGAQIHVRQKVESIHNPEMVPALDGGVAG
jgi:hypothetical protein